MDAATESREEAKPTRTYMQEEGKPAEPVNQAARDHETAAAAATSVAPTPEKRHTRLMMMSITLTEEQRREVGLKLVEKMEKLDRLKDRKSAISKKYSKRIGSVEGTIVKFRRIYKTGKRDEEREVYDVRDLEARVVRTVRLDTGEVVTTRPMTPTELQLKLGEGQAKRIRHDEGSGAVDVEQPDGPEQSAADIRREIEASGRTEEQVLAETPEEAEELRKHRLAQENAEREAEDRKSLLKAPRRRRRRPIEMTTEVRGVTYVVVAQESDGGRWEAATPEIDDLVGTGPELEDAVKGLQRAIELRLGPEPGAEEAPYEEERSVSGEPVEARYEPEGDDDLAF